MAHSRRYIELVGSMRWRRLRNSVISEHPVCQCCGRRASQCVHHIIPIESGVSDADMERLAYDVNNLQALCYDCHKQTHMNMRPCGKSIHRQREADRLEQWKSRIKKSK